MMVFSIILLMLFVCALALAFSFYVDRIEKKIDKILKLLEKKGE